MGERVRAVGGAGGDGGLETDVDVEGDGGDHAQDDEDYRADYEALLL
jgi:hypothetical protein